ncbi:ATP-dependent endonuclease, partial [Gemmatimonadota bacterium]
GDKSMEKIDQEELFPDIVQDEEPVAESYPSAFLAREPGAPTLVSVRIEGLKGFDDTQISLAPLTILTGPNNSGKSTVLQAIALGFECFRRCLDTERWKLQPSGRAVNELDFLPVNEPKDLWFEKVWKPSAREERYVRVTLLFSNGFSFVARIRFLFGGLNLGIEMEGDPPEEVLRALASASPVLLPTSPGPGAHEDYFPLAQIHRLLSMREPGRVIRNVLLRLMTEAEEGRTEGLEFVDHVLNKYFGTAIADMRFEESRDLEVRAPLVREDEAYSLDLVSAGSGLNQILMLAAVLAWRKPGIVLLDEPDAHLHSSVQAQLLDFLTDLADTFHIQIIAATHSRDLIGRAPLQSIVPVDRTRAEINPLHSLEHLLIEYERHGAVDNVDLALLYQTRRCLFVEGKKDVGLLPRVAERLGYDLFLGGDQVVPFEIGGVGKAKLVPELVRLFERMIGADLRWGVVRDSDANVPEVKNGFRKQAEELGFPIYHVWDRYSIENYLIEPQLVLAAVRRVAPGCEVSLEEIEELLGEVVASLEEHVDATFVSNTQIAYRDVLERENWHQDGAGAAVKFLKSLDGLDKKLHAYPGRRIFGRFVEAFQEREGVHLRIDDLVTVLDRDNAPAELIECLDKVAGV